VTETEDSARTSRDEYGGATSRAVTRVADEPPDESRICDAAFEVYIELHNREYAGVIAMLMRWRPSLPDAEDAAQGAFMEAWDLIRRDGWWTVRDPRAWIRGVALNIYRRPPGTRARVATVLVSELPEPTYRDEDPSSLPALAASVIAELGRLDEACRAVMVLTMESISTAEIAAMLKEGRGPVTEQDLQRVRDQRKKGRAILQRRLCGSDDQRTA
jgi:DNA-directed RNA polymerase specialized sigma24 family protein